MPLFCLTENLVWKFMSVINIDAHIISRCGFYFQEMEFNSKRVNIYNKEIKPNV